MAHPGFGHLWQQQEMSDVGIVISVAEDMAPAGTETPETQNSASTRTCLQQFPGHRTILSLSPYFVAQALRWAAPPQQQGSSQPGSAINTASSTQQTKKQINITLPDASYEPAAMAVLAGLYQFQPWPVLLDKLTPQQQGQAAVLADMWQLPAASEAAVGALQNTLQQPKVEDGFMCQRQHEEQVIAVLDQLLSLAAVPDVLMPVFERAVLCRYGDLEAVWSPQFFGSRGLPESLQLLRLPLHAVRLLLASDKLRVASEDTVLFTAQAYVDNLAAAGHDTQQAVDSLAPLVRCPHLSQFWLSASVLSDDAPQMVLRTLQPQLRRLLLLKQARSSSADQQYSMQRLAFLEDTQDLIPGTPDSWLLPQRNVEPCVRAYLFWQLDVAAFRQAAQDSASQQTSISLRSPESCLVRGIMWGMELRCSWDASKQGSTLGLFARANSLPAGSICPCTYRLHCVSYSAVPGPYVSQGFGMDSETGYFVGDKVISRGLPDVFGLGAMAGGFSEAAWAAKGLPTSDAPGILELQLIVYDMGYI